MPPTRNVPNTIQPPPVMVPGTTGETPTRRRPAHTRRRFWLGLGLTLLVSLALYPPPWQAALRLVLQAEARRHGGELTIGHLEGGLFETLHLYDVRCRQGGATADHTGTNLRIARVDLSPDWTFFLHVDHARRPWLRRLVLEGASGQYDLTPTSRPSPAGAGLPLGGGWLSRHVHRFVPTAFVLRAEDFNVRRGPYQVGLHELRLDSERGTPGFLLARELEISGPGFRNTLLNRHARTNWQGNRLRLDNLELTPGVALASLTIDGSRLGNRRLDWNGTLTALGGEVRTQGALNLSRSRLGLEVAGTLRALPVQSVARLLGLMGAAGGRIEQGSFSFRGEPEDWTAAETWLSAQATDFRWNRRQWQSLDLQAMVLHGRVQVNRLELRQSKNQLSFQGEFPLPTRTDGNFLAWPDTWREAGFSARIDARLEDLRTLGTLVGPRFPALDGRMSVNGKLEAMPGQTGIEGYLNVEGSQLVVRGAPLDYLRSTLLFHGDELRVADLQATHGGDYLGAKWTTRLVGASNYTGELKASVKDRAIYAPAFEGVADPARLGAPSDDPHAPIQVEGSFHGPGPDGEAIFQNTAPTAEPVSVPVPTVGEWWRDD